METNPEQIYQTTLAIRILPPSWLSWWAYCIARSFQVYHTSYRGDTGFLFDDSNEE